MRKNLKKVIDRKKKEKEEKIKQDNKQMDEIEAEKRRWQHF
jgi:hypothetical protein